jgi:hypothetical protein
MLGDNEDGMSDGHQCPLSTAPGRQAMILSGQVGMFGLGSSMSRLNEGAAQGGTAFASGTAQALSTALVVGWATPAQAAQ